MQMNGEPNGILNLKNTCYINSVLQLLSLCPELTRLLENTQDPSSEFLNLLFETLTSLHNGTGKTIEPKAFVQSSFDTFPNFLPYKQQDSLEYINYVFSKIFEKVPSAEDLFKGKQVQRIECLKCKRVVEAEDPFNTLGIPIPRHAQTSFPSVLFFSSLFCDQSSEFSLEDCLNQYFSCQKRALMHCSLCGEEKPQVLSEHIQFSSQYLIIYLKRSTGSFWNPKILTPVKPPQYFPSSLLTPNDKSNYRLFGLIEHSSYLSAKWGHYTCYILKGHSWFHISDSKVQKVSWQQVSQAQAYLMLFKRL